MNFKNFLLFLACISFNTFTITLGLDRATGQTSEEIDPTFKLAQVFKSNTSSEDDQQINVGVDEWLLKERIVALSGEVTYDSAERVVTQLLFLDAKAPGTDIYLYINSSGGDITSGLAIYDVMRSLRSNVVTVSLGESSSMASLLLAGGTRGKRLALPSSRIMIHQPLSYGVSGQASDIEISAKEILYARTILNRLLAELTGQPLKRIVVDTDRDFFMSAQEAKDYGIVDKVVNRLPSASRPLDK